MAVALRQSHSDLAGIATTFPPAQIPKDAWQQNWNKATRKEKEAKSAGIISK